MTHAFKDLLFMYPIMIKIISYTFSLQTLCSLNIIAKEVGAKKDSQTIRMIIMKRYSQILVISKSLYFYHHAKGPPSPNRCHICMQDHNVDMYHYSNHITSFYTGSFGLCQFCSHDIEVNVKIC